MVESPVYLLTIDLLCRVMCQVVLQPFLGVSRGGVCVPVAVRPSVCRPFVCNSGTIEGLLGQCNRTINCIAGDECFLCGC